MKVKNVVVGIQSLEEGLKEFASTVEAARRGLPPREAKTGIYFINLNALRQVLTPKRLGLLHLIREKRPDSIYGLARAAKRDLKNVQDDVAMLARIGLVDLSRAKTPRDRVIPRVEYDRLQLQIPM